MTSENTPDLNQTPQPEDAHTDVDGHTHDTATAASTGPVCVVNGLRVGLVGRGIDVIEDIDITLESGKILGLVGESGSGKTTAGTALLGYARSGAAIDDGSITVAGHDIRTMTTEQLRGIRGVDVAYVPQDPSSALNPAIRIGAQLRELLDLHDLGKPEERDGWIRDILPEVGLPNSDEFLSRYPHQLSGGQVQRVALAMVFLPRPKVLVLDEPTTGLDVTTQGKVLATLDDLCERFDVAALYVTHDLAVVATIADRVAVMYAGQVVELGPAREVFNNPAHPYTRALLRAIPHLHTPFTLTGIPGRAPSPGNRPSGCRFNDRCEFAIDACRAEVPALVDVASAQPGTPASDVTHDARCIRLAELPDWDPSDRVVSDTDPEGERDIILRVEDLQVYYGPAHVVHDVEFDLAKREIVALVGESGSGKTTISRCVGGLHKQWEGTMTLDGEPLVPGARRRTNEQRQRIQYIFQNPYQSLNPRRTVEQILLRPLALFGVATGAAARKRAAQLLESVVLSESTLKLKAGSLSGGERQRVAIARALAARPEILICDEITSALDVSIQGSIAELLTRIKNEHGISMLFVTHDLALVRSIADRVIVLQRGRVVESGLTAQVFDNPQQDYTRELVSHTPTLDAIAG
ncbi:MAG: ABC transporter ATP-binding protein [Dermatophilus congolensis]|nr:ABC transporter ATP-binding protein [Dermatophilus congolensis]